MKKRLPMFIVATLLVAISLACGAIFVHISQEKQPATPVSEVTMQDSTTQDSDKTTSVQESTNESSTSVAEESATNAVISTASTPTKNKNSEKETETIQNTAKLTEDASNDATNSDSHNYETFNNENQGHNNVVHSITTSITTLKKIVTQPTSKTSSKTITTKFTVKTTEPKKTTSTTQATTTETEPVVTEPPLTPVDPNCELFGAYYGLAEETLKSMTLEEKVGQMFLVSYPGYNIAMNQVSGAAPAGYVLFARDFQYSNPSSIRGNMDTLKSNSKYGLMLGCDEEGGGVVRFSMYTQYRATRFQSPLNLFKQGGLQAIFDEAAEKADMMKNLGLNYNLAPVVDMPRNSWSYIYGRSLGQDAATTAEFSAGVVNIWNEHGMMATLKHFPGYADNVDTHTGVAVDNRSAETFWNEDLQPFISGANAGVPMIMVNHNIINCWDGSKPASLSEAVHNVLRYDIGYSGLIITDGLTMGAVKSYASNGEAAVQAVLCGNDMICTEDFVGQYREVLNAVKDGRIPEEMVNNAVRRVLACKYQYGIL